jgi:hypothetical protein
MTYNPYPKELPMLPGNVYSDPFVTRYHKTQVFDRKNGVNTGKLSEMPSNHSIRENHQLAREHQQ